MANSCQLIVLLKWVPASWTQLVKKAGSRGKKNHADKKEMVGGQVSTD